MVQSPKIFIIYLQLGNENSKSGLNILSNLCNRLFPGSPQHTLAVDNSIKENIEFGYDNRFDLISGDNSSWEFSGWQKGIEWLLSREKTIQSDDIVVMANDTFHRSYGTEYLNLFTNNIVHKALSDGGIVGYVDGYPKSVELLGISFRYWIRSSLVFSRYSEFKQLLPLVIQNPKSDFFGNSKDAFFKKSAPLSINYQKYLRTWLFEEAQKTDEFQYEWHKKTNVNEDNLYFLQSKAWAILCEHRLSSQAQSKGIPLYSVNGLGIIKNSFSAEVNL